MPNLARDQTAAANSGPVNFSAVVCIRKAMLDTSLGGAEVPILANDLQLGLGLGLGLGSPDISE